MKRTMAVRRRQILKASGALAFSSLLPLRATAQQAARIVVPFAPGASNDLVGRMMAEALSKAVGRTYVVENRPGAGSMLGTQFVADARPADGRTLLLCATASMGILPAISKNVRYSVERDFDFIVRIASSPFGLAVRKGFPANDFAEFVQVAKSRPGEVRMGAAGVGALDYMGASLMQYEVDIDLNIIPYKGMGPVLTDIQGGHIDACIVSPASLRPLVEDGSVKMLAVFDTRRSDVLPDVPSAADIGHPDLRAGNWWGIAGPAGIPAETLQELQAAMVKIVNDPAFAQSLKEKGFDPAPLSGEAFKQFVLADFERWKTVAKRANVTLDG